MFAGYIAYCSQQGIISGYADGTFRPAGTVTGYQFLKMLLGALGYSAANEGFTGANWSVNVAKLASSLELTKSNSSFVGSAALTREEACLYAYNTLKATMVEYDTSGTSITVGGTTITTGASKASDVKNTSTKTIKNDGLMQFAEKYFTDLTLSSSTVDDFGRPANTWKNGSTKIGTYADNSDLIATYQGKVELGTLYSLVGKTVYNELVAKTADLTYYIDGASQTIGAISTYFVKDSTSKLGGNGDTVEVYLDDDDNVTIVVVNEYLLQATADYSSSKETLSVSAVNTNMTLASSTISNDDVTVSSFKNEDYILATATVSNGRYTIQSAKAADTITGTVSAFNNNSDATAPSNVTLGGTKYSYSAKAYDISNAIDYSIGDDATVVLDSQGNIIYVKDVVATTTNYVFIKEAADKSLSSDAAATAIFADGTTKEITIKKAVTALNTSYTSFNAADTTALAAVTNRWFTYSTDDNGKYTLTYVGKATNYSQDDVTTIVANSATVVANATAAFTTGLKGNSDTIFVVLDKDNDLTAYTGVANVPTIKNPSSGIEDGTNNVDVYATVKSGYAKFVFIDASLASVIDDSTGSSEDYIFVMNLKNQSYSSTDMTTLYVYNAIVANGTEATTITTNYSLGTAVYTLYNKVKTNSKDYITGMTVVDSSNSKYAKNTFTATSSDNVTYSSGTMTLGNDSLVMASDAKVYLVSTAKNINTDSGATYEVTYATTAQSVASLLKGYSVTGDYQAIKTTSTSNIVETLYVYVSAATSTVAAATTYATVVPNLTFCTTSATGTFDAVAAAAGTTVYVKAGAGYSVASGALTLAATSTSGVYSFVMPARALVAADFTVTGALTGVSMSFATNNFTIGFTSPVALDTADNVSVTITKDSAAVYSGTVACNVASSTVQTVTAPFTSAASLTGQVFNVSLSVTSGGQTYTYSGNVFCG